MHYFFSIAPKGDRDTTDTILTELPRLYLRKPLSIRAPRPCWTCKHSKLDRFVNRSVLIISLIIEGSKSATFAMINAHLASDTESEITKNCNRQYITTVDGLLTSS